MLLAEEIDAIIAQRETQHVVTAINPTLGRKIILLESTVSTWNNRKPVEINYYSVYFLLLQDHTQTKVCSEMYVPSCTVRVELHGPSLYKPPANWYTSVHQQGLPCQ